MIASASQPYYSIRDRRFSFGLDSVNCGQKKYCMLMKGLLFFSIHGFFFQTIESSERVDNTHMKRLLDPMTVGL